MVAAGKARVSGCRSCLSIIVLNKVFVCPGYEPSAVVPCGRAPQPSSKNRKGGSWAPTRKMPCPFPPPTPPTPAPASPPCCPPPCPPQLEEFKSTSRPRSRPRAAGTPGGGTTTATGAAGGASADENSHTTTASGEAPHCATAAGDRQDASGSPRRVTITQPQTQPQRQADGPANGDQPSTPMGGKVGSAAGGGWGSDTPAPDSIVRERSATPEATLHSTLGPVKVACACCCPPCCAVCWVPGGRACM